MDFLTSQGIHVGNLCRIDPWLYQEYLEAARQLYSLERRQKELSEGHEGLCEEYQMIEKRKLPRAIEKLTKRYNAILELGERETCIRN